jgi:response regulator RpfG family c-di-GMP phosphodiesterase
MTIEELQGMAGTLQHVVQAAIEGLGAKEAALSLRDHGQEEAANALSARERAVESREKAVSNVRDLAATRLAANKTLLGRLAECEEALRHARRERNEALERVERLTRQLAQHLGDAGTRPVEAPPLVVPGGEVGLRPPPDAGDIVRKMEEARKG